MELNEMDGGKQGKLLQLTGRACTVKNNVCSSTSAVAEHRPVNSSRIGFYILS